MFIIQPATDKPIDWPVTVEYAAPGGKIAKHTFTGYFKLLGDDERDEIMARSKVPEAQPQIGDTAADGAEAVGDSADAPVKANVWKDAAVDAILDVMTDWKGVVDQHRNPIEFNRENLRTAARSAIGFSLLRGINTALAEIATGARAKN
jgi:hypothetical protein